MADYPIFADVGAYMLRHLREKMCPAPIPSQNGIEICSPSDQSSDYLLGLFLYDVREEGGVASPPLRRNREGKMQKPSVSYSLYYMLFTNSSSQMGLKAPDLQKVIGRAAQVINDYSLVSPGELQPWLREEEPPIALTASNISLEDKVRIWQAVNKPYQISLFYKAAPVFLSSEIILDVPSVKETRFHVGPAGEGSRKRTEGGKAAPEEGRAAPVMGRGS